MQTLTLGPQGPQVPALGVGTWAWGDRLFWGYGKDFDKADVEGAFRASAEAGLTLFDTAEVYGFGESERLLGEFCQTSATPVCLATKYFPFPWRWRREDIHQALTESLARLGQSKITLYQIHWPWEFILKTPDFMAALAEEVQAGRIDCAGVSNYDAEQMRQAHRLLGERGVPLAVNQMSYSLLDRRIEENGVLAAAQELGITILAYSPLAQGLLTGKYTPDRVQTLQGGRKLNPRFSSQGLTRLAPILNGLKELAAKYEKTPAQVALNWLITQGNVIPIPGAKTAEQARQNSGALGWALSAEDWQTLGALKAMI